METRYKQTGRRQTSRRGARDQKLVYVGEDLRVDTMCNAAQRKFRMSSCTNSVNRIDGGVRRYEQMCLMLSHKKVLALLGNASVFFSHRIRPSKG